MKHHFKFFITTMIMFCFLGSLFGCTNLSVQETPKSTFQTILQPADMTPRLIEATEPSTAVEVSKNVGPAVVGITSAVGNSYSVGSGVAIAKGGYVLTNNHVIMSPQNIMLYLADGSNVSASFVWGDSALDLAILKSTKDLPYLKVADSADAIVGETVLAIGTPLQLQFKHSVTKGIVSALNRTVKFDTDGGESYLQSLVQHDASINPGNSGGPLINMKGQIIGINTLKIELAEGIGFAIPASVIKHVTSSVVKTGAYQAGYLGVFGYDAAISNYDKRSDKKEGVYILSVQDDSPAKKAGLKASDVIVSINDEPVHTMLDFQTMFYSFKKGDELTIKYWRDGKLKISQIVLGARPQLVVETEK